MSFLDEITVLILTYNEEANIGRTLAALSRFPRILILDSGSDDATLDIARRFSNVEIATRPFDSHAEQWNHGLNLCRAKSEWILALDADYVLPDTLVEEIAALSPPDDTSGFRAHFRFLVAGQPLRGTLYPPVTVLYRGQKAHYVQTGHTQRLVVKGRIAELRHRIDHNDRKPLARWFAAQMRYAQLEAEYLLSTPRHVLQRTDRLRRMGWPMVLLTPFYTLFVKRCILDGRAGWHYTLQRTTAECMIALAVTDNRLKQILK